MSKFPKKSKQQEAGKVQGKNKLIKRITELLTNQKPQGTKWEHRGVRRQNENRGTDKD